jgi:hypothetical protein
MGTSRTAMIYALKERKKKLAGHSNMQGVGNWSNDVYLKGGSFPKNLVQDVGGYVESYSNADGMVVCWAQHPFNQTKRNECLDRAGAGSQSDRELERIRLENERLAIEAAKNTLGQGGMSAGQIALITIGSIAALTGMVILIKKYGK